MFLGFRGHCHKGDIKKVGSWVHHNKRDWDRAWPPLSPVCVCNSSRESPVHHVTEHRQHAADYDKGRGVEEHRG